MGLPVAKLICASNANNVLTAFIRTGLYDRRRAFHKTASPSMDILVSSNLERYLYLESGRDAALVARLMRELTEKGAYTAPEGVRKALSERFWAGCADDTDTFRTIARVWHELGYLLDTPYRRRLVGLRALPPAGRQRPKDHCPRHGLALQVRRQRADRAGQSPRPRLRGAG